MAASAFAVLVKHRREPEAASALPLHRQAGIGSTFLIVNANDLH
ncbi:MAG: hypothetical protein ACTS5G_02745 [Burkholderiales bacterium]